MFTSSTSIPSKSEHRSWPTLLLVTPVIGVLSGLGGMSLALLLHWIQHVAFGYSLHQVIGHESFLQGVSADSVWRRLGVLIACGAVAGSGWWALYRYGERLVSIDKALKSPAPYMPMLSTLVHAVLQIVTVAMGSPLGREVAPREVGAVLASWLARRAHLNADDARIMTACGAGAGLAAVYNVPLGGALFVLEVLVGTFNCSVALPALATSSIAAIVASIGLGDTTQYTVPVYAISGSLIGWSIVCGPIIGLAACAFTRWTSMARTHAARGWHLPLATLLNFAVIGLLAGPFPALLGNGRGPAQVGFDGEMGVEIAATLLALKVLITLSTLRSGAMGGLLTPGLSNGALLAITLGGAWNHWFTAVPLGSFAIVGAAAFLATSMRMPLTAIVLLLEFTRVNQAFLVPMLLAVAGSGGMAMLVEHFRTTPIHDAAPDVAAPLVYTGIATAPLPPTSAGSP